MTNDMNQIINNDTEDIKIRRIKDILISSGTGVIIFAVWSVVRTILNFTLMHKESYDSFSDLLSETGAQAEISAWIIGSIVIMFGILALEVGLRIYMGLSARAEGKGKKKGKAYVVIAFIMIPIYVAGLVISIVNIATTDGSVIDMIVTIIVEATSLLALVEMAVSAVRLKRMEKHYAKLRGGEAA